MTPSRSLAMETVWMYQVIGISGRLLWIAAALTLITGVDYLKKALPHLKESR